MALLPKTGQIQQLMEAGVIIEDHRPRLGYSQMGGSCDRKLYYILRWSYKQEISRRLYRIFRRGDLEEPRIHADLLAEGFKVIEDQLTVHGPHGHIEGHIDGKVIGLPEPTVEKNEEVLLEIKTMNAKRYGEYCNKGLRKTNPAYYSQINSYMGKLGLAKCLFVVHNKNTEDRSYVMIPFDLNEFERIEARAHKILYSEEAPGRIGDVTWFECKFCDAKDICHKGAQVERNCRTCKHISLEDKGEWSCSHKDWHEIHSETIDIKFSNTLSLPRQKASCDRYEYDLEAFDV